MSILAKPKPSPADEIADARAKVHEIEAQRQTLWAASQRHLARADELRAARADLLLKGDTVDLIQNTEATEAALLLAQRHYGDYAALASSQQLAESAVRGAIGRRAPDRAREIAADYAARVERVREHAEAARDHAEALVVLESESETLYKTHGATVPALPLGGGALSLRSTLEVHILEPLQRYADAVARDREQAELAAAVSSKWQADRKRAREQFQGDPDAFSVDGPSLPESAISWTEVEDEHGRRKLYPEDKP